MAERVKDIAPEAGEDGNDPEVVVPPVKLPKKKAKRARKTPEAATAD